MSIREAEPMPNEGNALEVVATEAAWYGVEGKKEANIERVNVPDAWRNERFDDISASVDRLMEMGYEGDASIQTDRKRLSKINFDNPSTKELIDTVPNVEGWLALMPTAAALEPIYDPTMAKLSNGTEVSPELREWYHNIYDTIGIRSRAAVMEQSVFEQVRDCEKRGERARMLSLGCGAAQPVFNVMQRAEETGCETPHATLVDIDKQTLARANTMAHERGFEDDVVTKRRNVLARNGISYDPDAYGSVRRTLQSIRKFEKESYDVVDAVGLLEYLKKDDWSMAGKELAGAVQFIENAYDLVRPGGRLVVGNMLKSHPQLGFTLNVVQWPHIQPRTIDEMLACIDESGIEGEVDVQCPTDDVYALYTIRKPA